MKRKETLCKSFGLSACRKYFFVLMLSAAGFMANAQETKLIVISNTKGAPTDMKFEELKSIFSGQKQRWPGDIKVNLALVNPNNELYSLISRKVYNKSVNDLRYFWELASLKGDDVPETFKKTSDILDYVAETPGAISIVDKIPVDLSPKVRVILIDGKNSF